MKEITLRKQTSDKDFIKVTISTKRDYFSITGETKDSCGCIHEEILEHFPNLKPLVDLHLCSLSGTPVHFFGDGFYWAAKAAKIKMRFEPDQSPEQCKENLAKHLRVENVDELIGHMKLSYQAGENHDLGIEKAQLTLMNFISDLFSIWKEEADNALNLIDSLENKS